MVIIKARGFDSKTGAKVCGAYANFEDNGQVWHVIYDAEKRAFCQLNPDYIEFCTVRTKYGRICAVVWRSTDAFVGIDLEPVDQNEPSATRPSRSDLYFPNNLEIVE